MTDRARRGRRLAALGLVPLSAGAFGGGVAWAGSHDPVTAPTPAAAPVATATTDPQVTAALAEIADAKARIIALQATLDERAGAAAPATTAASSPSPTTAPTVTATLPAATPSAKVAATATARPTPAAAVPAPAPAPVPAPAPPVQTKTGASG